MTGCPSLPSKREGKADIKQRTRIEYYKMENINKIEGTSGGEGKLRMASSERKGGNLPPV